MARHPKQVLILMVFALLFSGCSDDDPTTPPADPPALAFAGSDACLACHGTIHANWSGSGHPYKITKINGVAPTASFPGHSAYGMDPIDPPAGYTWADISYTIGGFGWKMRFIDNNGYIITGSLAQYNFETQTRGAYNASIPVGTAKYDCGQCHTTGWVASDDGDATNNQDGLEGMVGTFFAGGIHCEECHGQGTQHVFSPADYSLVVDRSIDACARCHQRGDGTFIPAGGGFTQHRQNADEWKHSPHSAAGGPGCVDCHDPHSSVKWDATAPGSGTTKDCTVCHTTYAGANLKHPAITGLTCVTCHMPKTGKTAITVNAYVGDQRSHIWAINTAPVGKTAGMFNPGGGTVILDGAGMAKVTLDFACYSCHKDEAGVGGARSTKTLQQLSDYVLGVGTYAGTGGIHSPTKAAIAQR